jgi:ATP-dependent exoDNAse (exonuclease V) alpha subunit
LILGQAGTGKSTFVNYLKSASKKRIICVCPTAVSALNIGGQTIHSLFQIAPRDFILPEFLKLKSKPRNIISGADVLIIDEISMVSPDLLDAMDILARQARRNNKPFGGLQIVAIGDLFQLPPVISREAERMFFEAYGFPNSYFFDSHSYKRAEFGRVSFDFVYRQADEELLLNLCALRKGGDTSTSIAYFNGRKISDPAKLANAVVLTPYRAVADQINHAKLTAVVAPEVLYKGELSGNFPEKDTPSPVELRLKTGALVVFTKNSDRGDWHNGSMGIVQDLGHDIIKVKLLSDGNIVDVKRDKWQKIEYARDDNDKLTENESGSFKQFPLALGYAMTIHKSQGKTLDAVNIDMSRGAFAHGQTYVALSRTRRADDIHMQSCLRPRDVIFDRRVLEFVVE